MREAAASVALRSHPRVSRGDSSAIHRPLLADGARRSPCNAESCNYGRRVRPELSSRRSAARTADRALETDESRLVERDTQVDLEHGLEDGPCYPLSVKVDATRNASAYGLE